MQDYSALPDETGLRKSILDRLERQKEGEDYVDWDETPYVACDALCWTKRNPETLQEYKQALEHWRYHSRLGGCSHGR
jgi:hypothetical protein